MNELMLILALILCGLVLWRRDWFAPTSIFCLICAATMTTFYIMAVREIRPLSLSDWYFMKQRYTDVAASVLGFYLGLMALGFVADRLAGPRLSPTPPRSESSSEEAGTPPPPTPLLSDSEGARLQRHAEDSPRLETQMVHWLSSLPAVAGLTVLLALCIAHFIDLDAAKLLVYLQYRGVRDPVTAGITSAPLRFIHRNITLLGCVLAPLFAIYLKYRRLLPLFLAGTCFFYAVFVSCAFGSRFFVLQIALLAVSFQVLSRKRVSLAALITGAGAFVAYLTLMTTRRGHLYGLMPFFNILRRGRFFFDGWLGFLGLNIFSGGFNFADALTRRTAAYPAAYKLLSFSPLPSAIDHFASVRDYAQVRILSFMPYGGYSEAYFFGTWYLIALLAIVLICLIILTRFWRGHRGSLAFCIVAPSYYAMLSLPVYALRGPLRFLVLPTILAAGLMLWSRRRTVWPASPVESPAPSLTPDP